MTPPDVLLVADGGSPHTRKLARALSGRGIRVELATFERSGLDDVPEHRLGTRPAAEDLRYAIAVPALARLIRWRRPTVVHAHYVSSYGLMAALATAITRGHRPRLVVTAWGTDLLVTARRSGPRALLASLTMRRADLVTGDSSDVLAIAARLAPATPRMRFIFGPPPHLVEARRSPERIVVSARSLVRAMRVPLIVDAFTRWHAAGDDAAGWRLVVAGDGEEREVIAGRASLDPSIDVMGSLPESELHALLLRARLYVSIPRSDATSVTLLEALAAGAMPIVNALPANREWVDDEIGVTVPRDPTVEEVAAAIGRAVRHAAREGAIRARVRNVTLDEEVDRLVAAYPLR